MIKNFLITNLRALWKNRSHASINVMGLTLGITCSILIFLIIQFELSFDTYHPDRERIYRIVKEYLGGDEPSYGRGMTYPLPPALRQDFADPEYVTIVDANISNPVITITREDGTVDKFKESKVAFVDPDYFKMFHYDWVAGNSDAVVREKTVVLSESLAKKYFGNEPAMNKVINFNSEYDLTVSGVVKDPPLNTDLPFTLIVSNRLGSIKRGWDSWTGMASSINCFIRLNPSISKEEFDAKLRGWHMKYFTGEDAEQGKGFRFFLQPLNELHFDTRLGNFNNRTISTRTLLTLGLIGMLLLITACINFVNLNTVLIINRSKEVGIRKVMGSTRWQLVVQFLGETLIVSILSLTISIGLVELAVLYLTPFLGYNLDFHPLRDRTTLIFLVALPFIVTILSGLYPGVNLSRFQPVKVLKSKISDSGGKGISLRRALIVFQLVVSQVLIVSTILVVQQINHFMSQPLGLDSESIVEFRIPENKRELIHRLRDRLQTISGIKSVAWSNTGATAENSWSGGFEAEVKGEIIKEGAQVKFASEDYVETYGLTLLHGEDLIRSDSVTRFLVSESFARMLGFEKSEDAIGVPLNIWGHKAMIRGIVKDFHTNPLHQKLEPVIIMSQTDGYYIGAVKLKTQNVIQAIAEIQKAWEDIYPRYVFEYKFLDDTIANFYKAERRNSYLIGVFAGVAIFIGCIGLFGLISFMARSKTKEVGIRKTMGASVGQIVNLFSKEFVILVLISFAVSVPITYYFMEEWLENFAYRIYPGVSTFLLGMIVMFVVVLATVGIKSYKAAIANPVDALKDE